MNDIHIVMEWCPRRSLWTEEVVKGSPLKRVREMLGGRWSKSSGSLDDDMCAAFWNEQNGRKAMVLRMPRGLPLDAAYRIAEARS
jgi:hypothetical protein